MMPGHHSDPTPAAASGRGDQPAPPATPYAAGTARSPYAAGTPQSAYPPQPPDAPGSPYLPGPAQGPYPPESTRAPSFPGSVDLPEPLGPPQPYPQPAAPYPPPRPPRRLAWPGVLALVLVFALAGGLGYQAWQLDRLGTQLAEINRREAAERASDREQLETLAQRAAELERRAGQAFDPEAIAEAVLPSVFRVEAGDSIGTAFAVGSAAADGETNLLTNFHVVEDLWLVGGREVFLERTDQRYAAAILEVDAEVDLAWLRTDSSFTGLLPAGEEVRAGQPIVAVGAPLGLTDTVTTGVVSTAERDLLDGSGTHIQFDASVNPGNSGGPVINSAKEVVGITTLKAGDAEGIGFAVPMAVACDTFDVC